MSNEITLSPYYIACVSGGKDSLFMLKYILSNLDKYPLNAVVHFELDIDFPFIKNVIDYMESECRRFGIPFFRIKPTHTWEEIFYTQKKRGEHKGDIYGYPAPMGRWCVTSYKLTALSKFKKWQKENGHYTVSYIGYCVDEESRYKKRLSEQLHERYPLVEAKVEEKDILEWAKEQPIFNNYYLTNKRCGCMGCPCTSKLTWAYLHKYYPDKFEYFAGKIKESMIAFHKLVTFTEEPYEKWYGSIVNKWTKKLEEREKAVTEGRE